MSIKPTYIIAEAGVNHNGSPEMAFQLIDAAIDAGADAVKFQTFKAENLVSKSAEKADYQKLVTSTDESQFDMLQRLELSYELHHELIQYCKNRGIEFLSTAFDVESLNFLVESLGVETLKIPSGEINNAPLVLAHAQTGCNLIVSTGMATLSDVEFVLGVIAFGLTEAVDVSPSREAFARAYSSRNGQKVLREKVTLLHCTTEYPAPPCDINLAAIDTMQKAFSLPVGYSDHSKGIVIPIAAVSRGIRLIEKHFTLDKALDGPDHKASLEPDELKSMIDAIRIIEESIGDGVKEPQPSELKNIEVVRKSLVAAKDIPKGTIFTQENLTAKRPGCGLSPIYYWDILGKVALNDFKKGDLVRD